MQVGNMNEPSDLRNYYETSVDDIWRDRQEHFESEHYHQAHRRHADRALLEEASERDASILSTEWGDITVTIPKNAYSYDTTVVNKQLVPLLQRDGLMEEWNQFVRSTYKIDKRWLNKLVKRGGDYRDVIERMTIGSTGTPTLKGPSLAEMGGYTEER